jgi:hypothetical protein
MQVSTHSGADSVSANGVAAVLARPLRIPTPMPSAAMITLQSSDRLRDGLFEVRCF